MTVKRPTVTRLLRIRVRREALLKVLALSAVVIVTVGVLWLRFGPALPQTANAAAVNIAVGSNWFCDSSHNTSSNPCETTIDVGDTVVWDFTQGLHTSTECGTSCGTPPTTPLWDSGNRSSGQTFEFTFDIAGTYFYRCEIHPAQMRGQITVTAGAEPTATPTATEPTATPVDTPVPGAPTATPTETGSPTDTPIPATTTATAPAGTPGDADCSNEVTSIDAALMLQLNVGIVASLACEELGDVNGDGTVNAIDAALVLQFVVGVIPSLPV